MSAGLSLGLSVTLLLPATTPGVLVPLDDLSELELRLRDDDDRERRKAVIELAGLETEEAWDLVLGALADPAGMVADQAQLELPKLPESMGSRLFGKVGLASRSELVPLRVAEAIGRLPRIPAEKELLGALKHKDTDVRRSLLWSLERQAEAGRVVGEPTKLLERVQQLAERDRDPRVRAHALLALVDLAPEVARELFAEFAGSREVPLRVAAAESIPVLPEAERQAAALRAAEDEAFVVRIRAHEAFAALGTREAMGELVSALEREKRSRIQWRIVTLLRDASDLKHGLDSRPWRLWQSELPDDWIAPAPVDGREESELGDRTTSSFVGVRVVSDHLAFLIDFSGSMWKERGGKTRKERTDVELRRALEALRPEVRFNLHPYTAQPISWRKSLVEASPRNVAAAVEAFEGCREHGTGNFWAAMRAAAADPDVDTLMVLCDGAPSGGRRWNVELMKELFYHENRLRGLALDVLLVDCSGWLASQWEEMSRRSGGRCVGVEL